VSSLAWQKDQRTANRCARALCAGRRSGLVHWQPVRPRPDYIVEIRADILHETDGPMLQHSIKELHAQQIVIPRDKQSRPDPLLLEKRFDKFKETAAQATTGSLTSMARRSPNW
jgi:hypothetical protein